MVPTRAVVVHGYLASPQDHWFGWLAAQLDALDVRAQVPALPSPDRPNADDWLREAGSVIGVPDEQTVIVAHSLGCLTVLRHLAALEQPWRLDALVLVAGFLQPLPALPQLDEHIGEGLSVGTVAEHVHRLTVLRSDGDGYVPEAHTDRLAAELGTAAVVVPGAGHFLADDGVTELPEALAAVVGPGGGQAASGTP